MKNGMVRYWLYVTKGEKTKSYYTWNIIWLAIYIKNCYWTKINLNMTFKYVCCSVPMLTLHVIVLEKTETLVRGKLITRNLHLPTNAIYWQGRNNILLKKIRNSIYRFPYPWHHCTPWSNLAVWCTTSIEKRICFPLINYSDIRILS